MSDWLILSIIFGAIVLFGIGCALYNQYRTDELDKKAKWIGISLFCIPYFTFFAVIICGNFWVGLGIVLCIAVFCLVAYAIYNHYRTDELDERAKKIGIIILRIICFLFIAIFVFDISKTIFRIGLIITIVTLLMHFVHKYKEKKLKRLRMEPTKKLMDEVERALQNEGFRPERSDTQIRFKFEGHIFGVNFEENDASYFSIVYHIYTIGNDDVDYMLRLANKMNYSIRYAKTFVSNNDVYICTDAYIDENSNIEKVFFSLFRAIVLTRNEIINHSSYRKETSLN